MKASKLRRVLISMQKQAVAPQSERVARGANKGAADLRESLEVLDDLIVSIIRIMDGVPK